MKEPAKILMAAYNSFASTGPYRCSNTIFRPILFSTKATPQRLYEASPDVNRWLRFTETLFYLCDVKKKRPLINDQQLEA